MQNAPALTSVKTWLRWDESDPQLHKTVRRAIELIDAAHEPPSLERFVYSMKVFGWEVGPFKTDGCDVEWNDELVKFGAWGSFTPSTERPMHLQDKSVIHLTHKDPAKVLTLIHEVGHLAHTTWFLAGKTGPKRGLLAALGRSECFRNLELIANNLRRDYLFLERMHPGDPANVETGKLLARALYDASEAEWLARVYVWAVVRGDPQMPRDLVSREFGALAVDGVTRIYPAEEEMDGYGTGIVRVLSPGLRLFGRGKKAW